MDKEPPQPPEDRETDNVVEFPANEYMRSRQRHPAGKLGRKSIEETLRDLGRTDEPDDES